VGLGLSSFSKYDRAKDADIKKDRAQPLLNFLAKTYRERRNKTTRRPAATEQMG
jgi:hypothetical protein